MRLVISGEATKKELVNYKNALIMHCKLLSCNRISLDKTIRLEVYFHVTEKAFNASQRLVSTSFRSRD